MFAGALGQVHQILVAGVPNDGLGDDDHLLEAEFWTVQWQGLQVLGDALEGILVKTSGRIFHYR